MTVPINDEQGPIAGVREGMTVLDAAGEDVGTVAEVSLGDPAAATADGQRATGSGGVGGLVGAVVDAVGRDSDLPEGERDRLLRLGYVRVRGGPLGGSRYAAGDEVAAVEGDVVRLSVPQERLVGG